MYSLFHSIEDAAELKLNQDHVITLETRNMNYEKEFTKAIKRNNIEKIFNDE